jgi:hypothetical protein
MEDEVRAGLFDGAEIAISLVQREDPDGHGEIRLRRGALGETRLTPQGYFHAELRGLSQPLAPSTLEVFSPNCRADLGDHRCKFPIQPPELGRDQAASAGAFERGPCHGGDGLGPLRGAHLRGDRSGHDRIEPPPYEPRLAP